MSNCGSVNTCVLVKQGMQLDPNVHTQFACLGFSLTCTTLLEKSGDGVRRIGVYSCLLKEDFVDSSQAYFCLFQVFFEGVQEKIAAGVKAEEVGYQLAFSKQELRKCIKEVPAKEVGNSLTCLLLWI